MLSDRAERFAQAVHALNKVTLPPPDPSSRTPYRPKLSKL